MDTFFKFVNNHVSNEQLILLACYGFITSIYYYSKYTCIMIENVFLKENNFFNKTLSEIKVESEDDQIELESESESESESGDDQIELDSESESESEPEPEPEIEVEKIRKRKKIN